MIMAAESEETEARGYKTEKLISIIKYVKVLCRTLELRSNIKFNVILTKEILNYSVHAVRPSRSAMLLCCTVLTPFLLVQR
jgi:hypothetical protein